MDQQPSIQAALLLGYCAPGQHNHDIDSVMNSEVSTVSEREYSPQLVLLQMCGVCRPNRTEWHHDQILEIVPCTVNV
ncbi:hypothetical protein BDR04DRAFT_1105705 [Suillus decipiens]|nr:hypothetical protein BDR04DRAFT_1105705 [Suillus decipiens]